MNKAKKVFLAVGEPKHFEPLDLSWSACFFFINILQTLAFGYFFNIEEIAD